MNKVTSLCLSLVLVGTTLLSANALAPLPRPAAETVSNLAQSGDSITSFWEKFKAAVVNRDRAAVAALSQFPIAMPYGMSDIKTKAQLTRRYRSVFNHEGDAAKCFATANPSVGSPRPKEFTVGCKNSAGDEVVIYSFKLTRNGWRFSGLDNLNE
jgi:hypothetical protein